MIRLLKTIAEGVGGALGPVAASLQRPTLKGGFGAACRSR